MPDAIDRLNAAYKKAELTGDISPLENFDPGSGFVGDIARKEQKDRIEFFKKRKKKGGLFAQKRSEQVAGRRLRQKRRRMGRRATLISSDDANIRRKTLLGE